MSNSSDSIYISNIPIGYTGQDNTVNGSLSGSYPLCKPSLGGLTFNPGTGAGLVTQETENLFLIPPSGVCSINLHTGVAQIAGVSTITMTNGSGLNFALVTGLKLIEAYLNGGAGSASSITLSGGSTSPFAGWFGGGTGEPVRNGAGGPGADTRHICGDSIGFAVSATVANLLITNNDGANTATVNVLLAGC